MKRKFRVYHWQHVKISTRSTPRFPVGEQDKGSRDHRGFHGGNVKAKGNGWRKASGGSRAVGVERWEPLSPSCRGGEGDEGCDWNRNLHAENLWVLDFLGGVGSAVLSRPSSPAPFFLDSFAVETGKTAAEQTEIRKSMSDLEILKAGYSWVW